VIFFVFFRENYRMSGEPEEEEQLPDGPSVCLDDGRVLPVALMMDKDGHATEIMFDAHTILAGSAELGW
jgi:hypothetical protein